MEAPNKAVEIKAAVAAVVAFGTALWGMTGWTVLILLCCIVLDYATGTFAAIHAGEWSSSVARQGLWHKAGEIAVLLVATLCDIALKVLMDSAIAGNIMDVDLPSTAFTVLVAVWYIFTELGSIIENVAKLGAPVPAWLIKALAKLKNKADPDDSDTQISTPNSTPNSTPKD